MPGMRSAYTTAWHLLTEAQRKRLERDSWYCTAHSAPDRKFVEVPSAIAAEVRQMSKAKTLHVQRDVANGFPSHFARHASLHLAKMGGIDQFTLNRDLATFRAANRAKHQSWADISVSSAPSSLKMAEIVSDSAVLEDPVFLNDPWKAYACDPPFQSGDKVHTKSASQSSKENADLWAAFQPTLGQPRSSPPVAVKGPDTLELYDESLDMQLLLEKVGSLETATDSLRSSVEQRMETSSFEESMGCLREFLSTSVEQLNQCMLGHQNSSFEVLESLTLEQSERVEDRLASLALQIKELRADTFNSIASVEAEVCNGQTNGRRFERQQGVLSERLESALHDMHTKILTVERNFDSLANTFSKPYVKLEERIGEIVKECLQSNQSPADCSTTDDSFLHGVVAYARLSGLRNQALDGKAVQVDGFEESKGRWQVQPYGVKKSILVKRENLIPYRPLNEDICSTCHFQFDLEAFPQCECHDAKCPEQRGLSKTTSKLFASQSNVAANPFADLFAEGKRPSNFESCFVAEQSNQRSLIKF